MLIKYCDELLLSATSVDAGEWLPEVLNVSMGSLLAHVTLSDGSTIHESHSDSIDTLMAL